MTPRKRPVGKTHHVDWGVRNLPKDIKTKFDDVPMPWPAEYESKGVFQSTLSGGSTKWPRTQRFDASE